MPRSFITDDERTEIEALCEQSGAGSTIATELCVRISEARATLAALELMRAGRVAPVMGPRGEIAFQPTALEVGDIKTHCEAINAAVSS